jgi:hypothetical protein
MARRTTTARQSPDTRHGSAARKASCGHHHVCRRLLEPGSVAIVRAAFPGDLLRNADSTYRRAYRTLCSTRCSGVRTGVPKEIALREANRHKQLPATSSPTRGAIRRIGASQSAPPSSPSTRRHRDSREFLHQLVTNCLSRAHHTCGYFWGYRGRGSARYPKRHAMALTELGIRAAKPGLKPLKLYGGVGPYLLISPRGCQATRKADPLTTSISDPLSPRRRKDGSEAVCGFRAGPGSRADAGSGGGRGDAAAERVGLGIQADCA